MSCLLSDLVVGFAERLTRPLKVEVGIHGLGHYAPDFSYNPSSHRVRFTVCYRILSFGSAKFTGADDLTSEAD